MTALEKYSEKLKENAHKSYESYLAERAKDKDVPYYDTLRTAKTKRALSDAEYGTGASRLLSAGLSTSGYRDYLEGRAEENALDEAAYAERERALDEHQAKSGYEAYLSDYAGLQTKISESLIKDISRGYDFDFDNALGRAASAGLSATLAYSTAAEAVALAKRNAYNEALTFAKLNKLSAKQAKEYAKKLGLDEKNAERVYEEVSVFNKEERELLNSMTPNQYYNYIISRANKEKKG